MSLLRPSSVQYVETGKKTKPKSSASSQRDALRRVNRSVRRRLSTAERNADFKKEMDKITYDPNRKGLSDSKVYSKNWTESQTKRYMKARDMNRLAKKNATFDNIMRSLGAKAKYPTYYESQAPNRKRALKKKVETEAAKAFVDKMRETREQIGFYTITPRQKNYRTNRYPNERQMKHFYEKKVYDKMCFADLKEKRLLIENGLLKELALWLTWSTMWSFSGDSSLSKYEPSRAEAIFGGKLARSSFGGKLAPLMYWPNPVTRQRYVGYDLNLVNMILRCLVGGVIKEDTVNIDQWGNRKKTVKRMSHFPWYKDTGMRTNRGQSIVGWDSEKMQNWATPDQARYFVNFKLDPTEFNLKDNEVTTDGEGSVDSVRKTRFDIWGDYGGKELYNAITGIILIANEDDEETLFRMFPDGKPQIYGRSSILRKYGSSDNPAFPEHDFKTRIWARLTLLRDVWEQRAIADAEFSRKKEEFQQKRKEQQKQLRLLAKAQEFQSSDEEMGSGDSSDSSSSEESESDWFDEDE